MRYVSNIENIFDILNLIATQSRKCWVQLTPINRPGYYQETNAAKTMTISLLYAPIKIRNLV